MKNFIIIFLMLNVFLSSYTFCEKNNFDEYLKYFDQAQKNNDSCLEDLAHFAGWNWISYFSILNSDSIINNSHKKYKILNNYMSNIFNNKDGFLIRIVNLAVYKNFFVVPPYNDFKPDVCYIYKLNTESKYKIVYCNNNFNIKNLEFDTTKIELEIFKNKCYWKGNFTAINRFQLFSPPFDGVAISIKPSNGFAYHSEFYKYWDYEDGKILEFYPQHGQCKTLDEIKKLMKYLFSLGIFDDN